MLYRNEWPMPPLAELGSLRTQHPKSTHFMQFRADQEGLPLGTYTVAWCDLSQISSPLRWAVMHTEDKYFFHHKGFYWRGIRRAIRALVDNHRIVFGGSTISQQLAKNLYLTPDRTLIRKAYEAAITVLMEGILSKERILELYLNVIEWGPGIWGCSPAARYYFGKTPAEIDFAEAAFLASRISTPRQPLSDPVIERMWKRQVYIMTSMHVSDLLGEDECVDVCLRLLDFPYRLQPGAEMPGIRSEERLSPVHAKRRAVTPGLLRYVRSQRAARTG
jgi:monofunctional biosynthetic peptidoglycan transglycosylase